MHSLHPHHIPSNIFLSSSGSIWILGGATSRTSSILIRLGGAHQPNLTNKSVWRAAGIKRMICASVFSEICVYKHQKCVCRNWSDSLGGINRDSGYNDLERIREATLEPYVSTQDELSRRVWGRDTCNWITLAIEWDDRDRRTGKMQSVHPGWVFELATIFWVESPTSQPQAPRVIQQRHTWATPICSTRYRWGHPTVTGWSFLSRSLSGPTTAFLPTSQPCWVKMRYLQLMSWTRSLAWSAAFDAISFKTTTGLDNSQRRIVCEVWEIELSENDS